MFISQFCQRVSVGVSIFLFSLSAAYAEQGVQACASQTFTHQQCQFTAPALKHQQTKLITAQSGLGFAGEVAAACRNGKVQWGSATCEPVDPGSCSIPSTRFLSDTALCGHGAHAAPLANGQTRIALDDNGKGEVTYQCRDGELQAISATCGGETAQMDVAVSAQALLRTQNATSTKTGAHVFQIITAGPPSSSELLRQCTQFSTYDRTKTPTATLAMVSGDQYFYDVSCPYERSLTCDAEITTGIRGGSYDTRTAEHSQPPTYAMMQQMCVGQGFADIGEVLAVSQSYQNIIDEFTVTAVCTGKESLCAAAPVKAESISVDPVSCTDAVLTARNIKRPTGSPPTTDMLTSWCNSEDFSTFKAATEYHIVDQYGGFVWYDVDFSCGGYTGSTPLKAGCDGTSSIPFSGVGTERQTCDMAYVSATYTGEPHPLTQELTMPPSQSTVEAACDRAGYSILDRIVSSEIIDEGPPRRFYITAQCSGYTGDKSSCNAQDPCLGNVVPAGSATPHRCMPDGTCYENLCAETPITDASFCADCDGAQGTFTDSSTGNTCTVTAPLTPSGGTSTFDFANANYNGSATITCNNAAVASATGSCYRTCPGGVTLSWNDKNGQASCSQVAPTGVHIQNASISFNSSQNHTGTASFQCDNGNWRQTAANCKLDCSGEIRWGSGTAADGTNKTNLCRATIGSTRHTQGGTAASVTTRTAGSTGYTCNDGGFDLSGSSCDVGCAAQTVSWGNQCRASVPALNHLGSAPVSHGSNPSYTFADSISGTATFRCTDGGVTLVSGSCRYITGTRTGTWSSWTNSGSAYNCGTWSPATSTVDQGVPFTQTRSCSQNQTRSRTIYDVWNSAPTETVNRTETGSQTITVSQSQPATGTRSVVIGQSTGVWSPWENYGAKHSCSSWTPSESSVAQGELFQQSQTCKQPQRRQRDVYDELSSGGRVFRELEYDYRTIDVTATRDRIGESSIAVGTAPSDCPAGYTSGVLRINGSYTMTCYVDKGSPVLNDTCPSTHPTKYVDTNTGVTTCSRQVNLGTSSLKCPNPSYPYYVGNAPTPTYVSSRNVCTIPYLFQVGGWGQSSSTIGCATNYTASATAMFECEASRICGTGFLSNGTCLSYESIQQGPICPQGGSYFPGFFGGWQNGKCYEVKPIGQYCPSGKTLSGGLCI